MNWPLPQSDPLRLNLPQVSLAEKTYHVLRPSGKTRRAPKPNATATLSKPII